MVDSTHYNIILNMCHLWSVFSVFGHPSSIGHGLNIMEWILTQILPWLVTPTSCVLLLHQVTNVDKRNCI